jgi:N-acetylmuramoyl-L-alanine amidase
MKIVMSSGHGAKVAGASGPEPWGLEEHEEAVNVVTRTARFLKGLEVDIVTFEETVASTQQQNLENIVNFHNSHTRDLDVSVHFNANEITDRPVGTECLYVSQKDLARRVASAIATSSGLIDRGEKYRDGLYFLNQTEAPAILIEVCFVDSKADVEIYDENFDTICSAIARAIAGEAVPVPEPKPDSLFYARGACSWFGGPEDYGVSASEGLAFIYDYDEAPHLFLEHQPDGTTGLARRLNPGVFYVACRWDYDITPKGMLANPSRLALVRAGDREFLAWPADWGPHEDTDRVADLSPALIDALDLETDDEVEIIYPAP